MHSGAKKNARSPPQVELGPLGLWAPGQYSFAKFGELLGYWMTMEHLVGCSFSISVVLQLMLVEDRG